METLLLTVHKLLSMKRRMKVSGKRQRKHADVNRRNSKDHLSFSPLFHPDHSSREDSFGMKDSISYLSRTGILILLLKSSRAGSTLWTKMDGLAENRSLVLKLVARFLRS